MCMYATDIRRESYRVFVSYGYREGGLSCACMLRISGGKTIVCMYGTNINRDIYRVFVWYGYQEGELSRVCILRI